MPHPAAFREKAGHGISLFSKPCSPVLGSDQLFVLAGWHKQQWVQEHVHLLQLNRTAPVTTVSRHSFSREHSTTILCSPLSFSASLVSNRITLRGGVQLQARTAKMHRRGTYKACALTLDTQLFLFQGIYFCRCRSLLVLIRISCNIYYASAFRNCKK